MAAHVRGHKPVRSTPEPRVSDLSGRLGAVRPGGPCTSPIVRSQHGRSSGGPVTGPCNGADDRPSSNPSLPDLIRGGTSFRGDQHKAPYARPAHLRPRHQRPAGRPECFEPLRRARSRAADRRGHGAGGEEAPSRARLLRPAGPSPARRVPGPARPPRRPHPDRGARRDREGRAQSLGSQCAAQRLPPGGQRLPDPRGGPQPAGRGLRRHGGVEGPAPQDQGVLRGPPRRGVPRGAGHHGRLRVDRDVRADPAGRTGRHPLRGRVDLCPRGEHAARAHRPDDPVGARQGTGPGDARGQHPPRAGRPGGVRHQGPQRGAAHRAGSAARPGRRHPVDGRPGRRPASRRSPCARVWRPCSNAVSTRR